MVDWEGSRAEDRAFDLATLWFSADDAPDGPRPGLQVRLWRALRARATRGLRRVYLARLILRQVDWSIRCRDRATLTRYQRRAEATLRRLADDG